ncbi:MAG TPA: DUF5658 family protein [Bryobacteraceae bacterium]|jgi:hypothetical protein
MPLLQFAILQLLDALTTILFLHHGVHEANPLIRAVLGVTGHPAVALALPKALAVAVAFYAWRSGRQKMLRRINVAFALVVAWNVVAIVSA